MGRPLARLWDDVPALSSPERAWGGSKLAITSPLSERGCESPERSSFGGKAMGGDENVSNGASASGKRRLLDIYHQAKRERAAGEMK